MRNFKLVLVRHGESEANIINKAMKTGLLDSVPENFSEILDREVRLSDFGVLQATKTGQFLDNEFPDGFTKIIASDHVRAKETAAIVLSEVNWPNKSVLIDPMVGERNWGSYHKQERDFQLELLARNKRDPLHLVMPEGESMLGARLRARLILNQLAMEGHDTVLIFSHGEFIEAMWAEIEKMHTQQQIAFFESPEGNVANCHVVEFSGVDAGQQLSLTREYATKRSCNPSKKEFVYWDYSNISKELLSIKTLMSLVNKYPKHDYKTFLDKNKKD